MVTVQETFGTSAGKVWGMLKSKGPLTALALRKLTGLRESDVYGALGWLGREGKIAAIEERTGTYYKLSQ